VLVNGKGNQERYCFLSEPTCEAIRAWNEKREAKSDWLFTSRNGEKLTYSTLREIVLRLKRKAGVTARCNLHSFRHGFAREYLMHGGDLATLSDILGHRDIATTKIYSTFGMEDLRRKHRAHSPVATMLEFA
jgi:site-specific recombinase XerD